MFKHSNPYRLMEVSDHFGKYAKVPNPPADKELKQVTIGKAYWQESRTHRPRSERWSSSAQRGALKEWRASGPSFFVHGEEWLEDAGDYLQYKLFMRRSDRTFVLRAKGQPDVSCQISMNFYTRARKLCELEVIIPPADTPRWPRACLHAAPGQRQERLRVEGARGGYANAPVAKRPGANPVNAPSRADRVRPQTLVDQGDALGRGGSGSPRVSTGTAQILEMHLGIR